MQLYTNLLVIYFILLETQLLQNTEFIVLTVSYFVLRYIYKAIKVAFINIEKEKVSKENKEIMDSLRVEPRKKKKVVEVKDELVVEKIDNKPIAIENKIYKMSEKEKKQQEEYLKNIKSKIS